MPYTADSLIFDVNLSVNDVKQLVNILTPVFNFDTPHRRKDSYTLKVTCNTGGDDLFVLIYTENDTVPIIVDTINCSVLQDNLIDISYTIGIVKSWQVQLVGQLTDFKLTDINILFGLRPEQLTFYRNLIQGLGPNKKRIRVWPILIDTLGYDVLVVPSVDGVDQTSLTINSSYPKTFLYQFITDVFGIDYAMTLSGCGPFELFDIENPTGVQILPIAKRFDQVGSEELFRYGKVKAFSTRIIAFGGTSIPFTIYFQDESQYTGTITVEDSKEVTVFTGVPKTVAGAVLRIEYGPTSFNFHRFYTLLQATKSGRDTEMEWIPLTSDWEKKIQE